MSATISGEAELKRTLLSLGKGMDEAIGKAVFATANDVRRGAIKSIQFQSFGTHVKRSRQGGGTYDHIAAAPNKAPNTDTGKLVNSIAVEMDWDDNSADIGSNLDYASWLEFGTKKMEPRPWLSPAVDSVDFDKNLRKVILSTIKAKSKK